MLEPHIVRKSRVVAEIFAGNQPGAVSRERAASRTLILKRAHAIDQDRSPARQNARGYAIPIHGEE